MLGDKEHTMPELQAVSFDNDGSVQYLGKLTAISKPVTDDEGNVVYTVTSEMFGEDNGLHTFTERSPFEPEH
jgi:hypothetical protein